MSAAVEAPRRAAQTQRPALEKQGPCLIASMTFKRT